LVKFKDTDFLHASSRVKSMEKYLLTSRQLNQMADAHTIDETYKIVNDAGIGAGFGVQDYEQALKANLQDTYRLLGELSGGTDVFNIFRYEHDGLNLKSLIKAQALDRDPTPMMTELGTIPVAVIRELFRQKQLDKLHPRLAEAAVEALDSLAKTGDPQVVDVLLDKAVLAAMSETAAMYNSSFIQKLVRSRIDISNIRCMVRICRMDGTPEFFRRVVAPGGSLSKGGCIEAYQKGMDSIIAFIESSSYGQVLEPAMGSLRAGGSLTLFEKLCDNYMVRLLDDARLVPFGIEPLVVYLVAKENEIKAARIVLASRLAGVNPEQIKERLRESYA